MKKCNCAHCGTPLLRIDSRVRNSRNQFCNCVCRNEYFKHPRKVNVLTINTTYIDIILSNGQSTQVDLCNYDSIKDIYWWAQSNGSKNSRLCVIGRVDGKKVRLHRYLTNAPADMDVDHIDHNPLNNLNSNLRTCTHHQNQMNMSSSRGSSQYKGVYFRKDMAKWVAGIKVDGKRILLGNFLHEYQAAEAYNCAASKYFGEFAGLNIIESNLANVA